MGKQTFCIIPSTDWELMCQNIHTTTNSKYWKDKHGGFKFAILRVNRTSCGSVGNVLDFESGDSKFESHCSQHVVVSLGKTRHPKLLLWGLSTVLNVCKSLWIKRLTSDVM